MLCSTILRFRFSSGTIDFHDILVGLLHIERLMAHNRVQMLYNACPLLLVRSDTAYEQRLAVAVRGSNSSARRSKSRLL